MQSLPRQRGKSGFREGWSLNSLLPADDQKVPFHGGGQQDIVPWNAASGREVATLAVRAFSSISPDQGSVRVENELG